ncbi:MAG: LOG family protein, partial [Leucobacter sp.]
HRKPVALVDVDGFWNPLLAMLDRMTDRGFLSAGLRASLIVAGTPEELFDAIGRWKPEPPKWERSG